MRHEQSTPVLVYGMYCALYTIVMDTGRGCATFKANVGSAVHHGRQITKSQTEVSKAGCIGKSPEEGTFAAVRSRRSDRGPKKEAMSLFARAGLGARAAR